jgi:predicted Zn-dependent peptidase
MDPDANLKEQRELAAEIVSINDKADDDGLMSASEQADVNDAAVRLAELVQALDQWLSGGGFQPAAWCYPFEGKRP